MCNGEVELRALDDRWYWFHIDASGFDVCQSRRGFVTRGAALDDYDKCKADYLAELRCRHQADA